MIEIAKIRPDEGSEALRLIISVAEQQIFADYTAEGREAFRHYLTAASLAAEDAENFVFVARQEGALVGIAKVRSKNHLSMLFVAGPWQGQGLGRRLLATALVECKARNPEITSMTANASRFGLPFFQRQGFRIVEQEKEYNGIRFTPVRLDFASAS